MGQLRVVDGPPSGGLVPRPPRRPPLRRPGQARWRSQSVAADELAWRLARPCALRPVRLRGRRLRRAQVSRCALARCRPALAARLAARDRRRPPGPRGRAGSSRVESVSAGNGAPIRLRMDPANGVTGLEPATAVVTVLNPEEPGSIRSSFCNQVHFFTDPEDSRDWLAEHPAGQALPVTEAYALGRSLASTFAAEPANVPGNACGPTDCCC
ncbi:MAG: hypothetical protein LCI03_08895 [Actinobacteria bacterium]|nr:hypothetical protein [Actinomycetota bacterium]